MDHMPPELHHEVCAYLLPEDLPTYRLVNKTFASVGAARLFQQVRFHASFASFDRVVYLSTHAELHKYVKKMIWDANVWDMGEDISDFGAFRAYVRNKFTRYWTIQMHEDRKTRSHFTKDEQSSPKFQADLETEIQQGYVLYRQRKVEELAVLSVQLSSSSLAVVLGRFINLSEVAVLNGWHAQHSWLPGPYPFLLLTSCPIWSPRHQDRYLNDLVTRGWGVCEDNLQSGLPAHRALENSMSALGCQMRALEVDHLCFKTFDPCYDIAQAARGFPNITKLHLAILMQMENYIDSMDELLTDQPAECRATMKKGILKDFVAALTKLEELKLRFPRRCEPYVQAVDLANVLPLDRMGLQALCLQQFETSEEHITKLLESNATTLKSLILADIFLSPHGSWERIFRKVRDRIDLTSAHFTGYLCDSVQYDLNWDDVDNRLYNGMEDGWDFIQHSDDIEGGLRTQLPKYLIDGAEYPLKPDNRLGSTRGFFDTA
jgi:hypothetical protein